MRGFSRPSRTGRAAPEALQASFGSHSESAFPDDCCAQRVSGLCRESGGCRHWSNKQIARNWGKSAIMACRTSTKVWLDR
jgi:hypothetical protein